MILNPAKEGVRYELESGEAFVASALNVSEFIADRMQREGVTKVEDLFEPIKDKFNKKVTHPFPGFYGSTVWKQVALQKMARYLKNHVKAKKNEPYLCDNPSGMYRIQ